MTRAACAWILAALILTGCAPAPVTVAPRTWPAARPLDLRMGQRLIISGYWPEAVRVTDTGILALQPTDDDSPTRAASVTYLAVAAGETQLIATHSMCATITATCGEPALYYALSVRVR